MCPPLLDKAIKLFILFYSTPNSVSEIQFGTSAEAEYSASARSLLSGPLRTPASSHDKSIYMLKSKHKHTGPERHISSHPCCLPLQQEAAEREPHISSPEVLAVMKPCDSDWGLKRMAFKPRSRPVLGLDETQVLDVPSQKKLVRQSDR